MPGGHLRWGVPAGGGDRHCSCSGNVGAAIAARSFTGCNAEKNAPSVRVDFPVSGENVRAADKRGAGPAGLAAKLTGGVSFLR